uniref:Uncharacterized protein n=1 Tax=Oryza rufipogon TaxID=4529 RepID=A0A0E0QRE5_ORYRU
MGSSVYGVAGGEWIWFGMLYGWRSIGGGHGRTWPGETETELGSVLCGEKGRARRLFIGGRCRFACEGRFAGGGRGRHGDDFVKEKGTAPASVRDWLVMAAVHTRRRQ